MASASSVADLTCAICGHVPLAQERTEQAEVRSNVRAFQHQVFKVWRCGQCASIHARDEVDLAYYYRGYVFHALTVDWRLRLMYDNQVARLRTAGLKPGQRVLDYGCGSGHFVTHLRSRGYDAVGYDEYSEQFAERSLLEARYDCVFSQDVIEHVPSPHALLDRFDGLVEKGGLIAIGTPEASAIDLRRPADFEHPLHQPYHRHILSKQALLSVAAKRGWQAVSYFPTQYSNTRYPFLNFRFYVYYARLHDNSLDVLIEPTRAWKLLLFLPVSLFWGLFGYFFAPQTDVMAMFRRP
jgi:2-polyprenyl-3-methyl-5-hydroxy-6-metoxy-1,4-benzoquinol methylase